MKFLKTGILRRSARGKKLLFVYLAQSSKTDSAYTTVWSSELDTLLMRYVVKFTSYRIKSVHCVLYYESKALK